MFCGIAATQHDAAPYDRRQYKEAEASFNTAFSAIQKIKNSTMRLEQLKILVKSRNEYKEGLDCDENIAEATRVLEQMMIFQKEIIAQEQLQFAYFVGQKAIYLYKYTSHDAKTTPIIQAQLQQAIDIAQDKLVTDPEIQSTLNKCRKCLAKMEATQSQDNQQSSNIVLG